MSGLFRRFETARPASAAHPARALGGGDRDPRPRPRPFRGHLQLRQFLPASTPARCGTSRPWSSRVPRIRSRTGPRPRLSYARLRRLQGPDQDGRGTRGHVDGHGRADRSGGCEAGVRRGGERGSLPGLGSGGDSRAPVPRLRGRGRRSARCSCSLMGSGSGSSGRTLASWARRSPSTGGPERSWASLSPAIEVGTLRRDRRVDSARSVESVARSSAPRHRP